MYKRQLATIYGITKYDLVVRTPSKRLVTAMGARLKLSKIMEEKEAYEFIKSYNKI